VNIDVGYLHQGCALG